MIMRNVRSEGSYRERRCIAHGLVSSPNWIRQKEIVLRAFSSLKSSSLVDEEWLDCQAASLLQGIATRAQKCACNMEILLAVFCKQPEEAVNVSAFTIRDRFTPMKRNS